jgi:hypothetical protein
MNKVEMQTGFVIQCRNPRRKDKNSWIDCSNSFEEIEETRERLGALRSDKLARGKEFRVVYRVETIMPL